MKVIFLDRDGVINKYPGDKLYVTNMADFKFINGSIAAIKKLFLSGYKIFVISNQAGVTKGLYSKKTLNIMTRYMRKEAKKQGGRIHKVLYCLHTKERNCSCRKPGIGLLKKAVYGMPKIDLNNSFFIGDSIIDVKAGKAFGCKTVLVLSGREKLKNAPQWDASPDFIARSLAAAAKNILNNKYERA